MSKRLEDFIKANKEEFDDLEPWADLWSRIEKHLPAEDEPKKREAKHFRWVCAAGGGIGDCGDGHKLCYIFKERTKHRLLIWLP